MSTRGSLVLRLALGAAAVLAVVPASASAALTSSSIDSPADGSLLRYDDASGPTTVHVTGTASPPGSHVDVRCINPNGQPNLGPTSLDIATDATTGDFEADVTPPLGNLCRLRALDANDPPPSDLSSFTGPRIAVSGLKSFSVGTGSNAGKATDYYIASLLFSAGTDFNSIGLCGFEDSYLFAPSLAFVPVFNCAAYTPLTGAQGGDASVEVDGHPAYGPWTVHQGSSDFFSAFEDRQPYPDLGYSYHIDPATHDLTIHETDHFVTCKPNAETFPPTAASCTAFADASVKLDRTIVADHGQHLVRFLDRWSSTNGHAHLLTTKYENDHCLVRSACTSNVGFRFPGQSAYTVPPDGTTSNGPFRAPGSVFVKDRAGTAGTAQGATVYSAAPDSVYLFRRPALGSGYVLDYLDRSVPAHGSLDFRFGYAHAFTTAAVTGLSRPVEDAYGPPRATIDTPGDGARTANARVLVRGSATDSVGVSSFTLNGLPVVLARGGSFAKRVKLSAGNNVFTAVARDAAGNTGRARATLFELLARTHKARAKRRKRAVVVDSGQALVCPPSSGPCTVKLAARRAHRKVGKATLTVRAGERRELKFKLSSKGKKALRKRKHLKIRLKIDIRYGTLAHLKTSRTFSVKRP